MNKKAVLSIIGVIILGALGSGLWELVKPMLGWAWSAIITISTLGLDSLRDGIYAQAASLLGRAVGLGIALQSLTGLIFLLCVLTTRMLVVSGSLRRTTHLTRYQIILSIGAIALLVAAVRTTYVTQLSHYYEQLETIAAPHISDVEMKQYRATLAQVETRDEFLKLVQSLSSRIEAAGKKAPTRTFF